MIIVDMEAFKTVSILKPPNAITLMEYQGS